tara:strand:+ start:768 stop:1034 length:267 start_codon:yes stop_codon:yes gene_type:complete
MKQKDARMALVSEAIGAIRAVKLHAWEAEFEARIAALRSREVATLLHFQARNGRSEGPSRWRQILVSADRAIIHSADSRPSMARGCPP